MKEAAVINRDADAIMSQPDFENKISDLMNTKVTVPKGKYDCTRIETTLNEIFESTIKGTYEKPVGTLYHGTNSGSFKDIKTNGFSKDACYITESGKGIYFGVSKEGAEAYSTGGVISAKYTGGKIADVEAGVVGEIGYNINIRKLFEEKFGLPYLDEKSDKIINEILNRMYTKKLNSLGYDAVHTASIGAGCEYINILDPKHITII